MQGIFLGRAVVELFCTLCCFHDYSLVKLIELHIKNSQFYHMDIKNKAKTYLHKRVYYMLVSVFCLCVHDSSNVCKTHTRMYTCTHLSVVGSVAGTVRCGCP